MLNNIGKKVVNMYILRCYKSACLIGLLLVFLATSAGASDSRCFKCEIGNEPVPKRKTVSDVKDFSPTIFSTFFLETSPVPALGMLSHISPDLGMLPHISPSVEQQRQILYRRLAEGNYDDAIRDAREYIDSLLPVLDDWKNCALFSKLQWTLATAYELKGEWEKALGRYAIVYGENSNDFLWAKIRILYASGNKLDAFYFVCRFLNSQNFNPTVIESVLAKIEERQKSRDKKGGKKGGTTNVAILFDSGRNVVDFEWKTLWKLRDNCARVICPELYFVTSVRSQNNDGLTSFYETQQKAFQDFITFFEEELNELVNQRAASAGFAEGEKLKDEYWENVELLKKLDAIPYKL